MNTPEPEQTRHPSSEEQQHMEDLILAVRINAAAHDRVDQIEDENESLRQDILELRWVGEQLISFACISGYVGAGFAEQMRGRTIRSVMLAIAERAITFNHSPQDQGFVNALKLHASRCASLGSTMMVTGIESHTPLINILIARMDELAEYRRKDPNRAAYNKYTTPEP